MRADVLVVGGGITGLAAAFELARAGCRVSLFEARRIGAMASGVTLGGVRQSGRHPAELPLARAAVALWRELDDVLEAPTGYRRTGNLRLARSAEEAGTIARMVRTQRALGLDIAFLADPADIAALAPGLGDGVVAASFCPSDGRAEPAAVLAAYVKALGRLDVAIHEAEPVRAVAVERGRVVGIETGSGRVAAPNVVLAAGIDSNRLLAPLGLAVPLAVPEVVGFRTLPLPPCLGPVIGVADAEIAFRQQMDGSFRVTGAAADAVAGRPRGPRLGALARLLDAFSALLPEAADAPLAESWIGFLDQTPDALPVIEACEEPRGLVLAFGFSGHGFALGPIVGRLVAGMVAGRPPGLSLGAFRRDRFGRPGAPAGVTLHG